MCEYDTGSQGTELKKYENMYCHQRWDNETNQNTSHFSNKRIFIDKILQQNWDGQYTRIHGIVIVEIIFGLCALFPKKQV